MDGTGIRTRDQMVASYSFKCSKFLCHSIVAWFFSQRDNVGKYFFIFYYQVTTTKCWQRRSAGEGCNLQKLFLKLIFYLSHFPLFLSFLSYQGTILFIWLSLSFFLSFVFSNSLSFSLSLLWVCKLCSIFNLSSFHLCLLL